MKTATTFLRASFTVSFLTVMVLIAGQFAVAAALTKARASSLNELENHFQKAKDDFMNKDYAKAASEIREAEAYVHSQAEQARGKAKEELVAADNELDGLAKKLKEGTVKSEKEISASASHTYHALAQYDVGRASESFSKKAESAAGEYLKTGADMLDKAWAWSGREIHSGASKAIMVARETADKAEKGSKEASAEVSQAIHDLRREIADFRNKSSEDSPKSQSIELLPVPSPESSAAHENLITAISKVAESTVPAVVLIQVIERQEVANPLLPFENNPFFRQFFGLPKNMPKKFKKELMGLGSGMIISPDGLILSNNHVVGGATQIKVLLSSGDEYPAKLVGADPLTDLGVIKISADKPLPCVTFGDSDQVMVGQWVVAIGQPRGLEQSVTQGIISAKHRTGITNPSSYQDFLQTDAAINPGNSGGPLLTLGGQVIGVNSAIATQSGGFEGIGFAIPSKMAVHVANSLIAYGKVVRGWLGVSIQEVTPSLAQSFGLPFPEGALIAQVMKGGPADEAGIKRGDVILKYDGQKVSDSSSLRNMVAATTPGQEVKVEVWRDKKPMELTVKIGNLEELAKKLAAVVKDRLGAEVGPVTAEEAQQYGLSSPEGVTVDSVEPNGPLGKAGFEKGDLILAVNKQAVPGVDAFVSMIESLPHHQKVTLLALDHRTGNTTYVQVEVN